MVMQTSALSGVLGLWAFLTQILTIQEHLQSWLHTLMKPLAKTKPLKQKPPYWRLFLLLGFDNLDQSIVDSHTVCIVRPVHLCPENQVCSSRPLQSCRFLARFK